MATNFTIRYLGKITGPLVTPLLSVQNLYFPQANAVLAGADARTVEGAFQYGRHIGIAFQLVDDLLDFTSSAEQLG
jgi:Polyprenyl synthetase